MPSRWVVSIMRSGRGEWYKTLNTSHYFYGVKEDEDLVKLFRGKSRTNAASSSGANHEVTMVVDDDVT
eukprot:7063376-Karenia_brevis.AAC.1